MTWSDGHSGGTRAKLGNRRRPGLANMEKTMRLAGNVLTSLLLLAVSVPGIAGDLRIAAWNLEHLDDTDEAGCVGRISADYSALARQVIELNADIIAFQEVENAAAAHRVFPENQWHVEMSGRPSTGPSRTCWGKPDAQVGHLATGFAIRRGVANRRHVDLSALGADDSFLRWGTDIAVTEKGRSLRLLSVHLKSGCWGAKQDSETKSEKVCATLRGQMEQLKAWADARRAEGTAFVILGDFNRRLVLPDDWAWRLLSPSEAPLRLLTESELTRCDPRYTAFIDHLVAGGGAEVMPAPGSFREAARQGKHPDHCAVSAVFRIGS